MRMWCARLRPLALAVVPVMLSAAVFWTVTDNFFHLDDYEHLFMLRDGRLGEFLITPYGGHALLVRNLVFAAMHAVFGTEPRGYLWCALLTHLLNVALLFALIRFITGSATLACVGATAWGTAPMHAETIGWYSVYGQVFMTTLLLWCWTDVARVARAGIVPSWPRQLAWYAALLAASLSFGVGIGLAMAFAPAAALLLREPGQRSSRWLLGSLLVAVPALYALTHAAYAALIGHAHPSAGQLSAALGALAPIARMTALLIASGAMGLLAGPWMATVPSVESQWTCAAAALVVLAAAAVASADLRRQLAVALLLALGGYGVIAAGRAPTTPTQWMNWPRYHYAAVAPLAVAACVALAAFNGRVRLPRAPRQLLFAAWLAVAVAGIVMHPVAIDHYDRERQQVEQMRAALTERWAAAPAGGAVYIENRRLLPMGLFVPKSVFPGWAGLYVIFSSPDDATRPPVYFVERSVAAVEAARHRVGSRAAAVLVSEAEYEAATGR